MEEATLKIRIQILCTVAGAEGGGDRVAWPARASRNTWIVWKAAQLTPKAGVAEKFPEISGREALSSSCESPVQFRGAQSRRVSSDSESVSSQFNAEEFRKAMSAVSEQWRWCEGESEQGTDLKSISGCGRTVGSNCYILIIATICQQRNKHETSAEEFIC